jgi:hypothetical protein
MKIILTFHLIGPLKFGWMIIRNITLPPFPWLKQLTLESNYSSVINQGHSITNFFFHSIDDRVTLRKNLDCKPFQWYIDHVYPELLQRLPSAQGSRTSGSSGIIQYQQSLCLDTYGRRAGGHVGLYTCHSTGGNQVHRSHLIQLSA